jgi:DNA invertase Pin-like site-specific DNA recombinase
LTIFKSNPVTPQGDCSFLVAPPKKQRRPGPKHPNYGIPPEQWPDVLRRAEQGESLRQLARAYNVSYQTIWRILQATRRQEGGNA